MIKHNELKKGVELCLENGKRLLDDAIILQKEKKYTSAIPLFILAYEEINKANFLEEKRFDDKDVSESEYEDFFGKRSHLNKAKIHYEIKKKTLAEMSDEEYDKLRNHIMSKKSLGWHETRKMALLQIDNALMLLNKLNKIKKLFLYVDFHDKKWQYPQNSFSNKILDNLCELIYYTALEAYLEIKFILDMEQHGYYKKGPPPNSEDETRMIENQFLLERNKLHELFKTTRWQNTRNNATRFILKI